MTKTYDIKGIHCSGCVGRISSALKPFAESVSVTLDPPRATLNEMRVGVTIATLNAAVAKVGAYTLVQSSGSTSENRDSGTNAVSASWFDTYWPLAIIVAYIALASLAGTSLSGEHPATTWMLNFMAGFFLVFSAFKFLDLKGFASAYATYDLLAKRWPTYGLIYPFLELALGIAYLFRLMPTATNVATVLLMGFSSLGVLAALRKKQQIQCACLGTVLKLPMSTITLVEDIGMAGMAALMLLV